MQTSTIVFNTLKAHFYTVYISSDLFVQKLNWMILESSFSWPPVTFLYLSLSALSHDERCSACSARREVNTRWQPRDSDSEQAERRRRWRRLNTRRLTNPPTDQPAKQPNHQPEAQTCHGHAGLTRPSPFAQELNNHSGATNLKHRLLSSPRCFLLFDTKISGPNTTYTYTIARSIVILFFYF